MGRGLSKIQREILVFTLANRKRPMAENNYWRHRHKGRLPPDVFNPELVSELCGIQMNRPVYTPEGARLVDGGNIYCHPAPPTLTEKPEEPTPAFAPA